MSRRKKTNSRRPGFYAGAAIVGDDVERLLIWWCQQHGARCPICLGETALFPLFTALELDAAMPSGMRPHLLRVRGEYGQRAVVALCGECRLLDVMDLRAWVGEVAPTL